jgi:hypothetical protein
MMTRSVKVLVGGSILAAALLIASPPVFASTSGGKIQIWVTPNPSNNGGGTVLITGAVGDYGTAQEVNAAGKPDSKGKYREVKLTKGTILFNLTAYQAAQNSAKFVFNTSTCTGYSSSGAPIQFVSGTGAYLGIKGSATLNSEIALILPKKKNGSCNENANPLSSYSSVYGSGTVSF